MHYEIDIGRIRGFAEHAAAPDQKLAVCTRGFFTPDDGYRFYSKLESLQSLALRPYFEAGGLPATITHFLVVMQGEMGQVFVNEPPILVNMVGRRAITAGEKIYKSDVGGIGAVRFVDLEISPNSGIIFYFTIGWRRGLFFDLRPLEGEPLGDIDRILGEHYDRLWFSDLYSIPNELWSKIFDTGWFPFIHLIGGTFESLPHFLERGIVPAWENGVLEQIKENHLREWIDAWRDIEELREHIPFVERAVERYAAGDFVSTISILWPRIEGMLRHLYLGPEEKPGQKKLLANVREIMEKKAEAPNSYLPGLFEQYLLRYYFRDFSVKENRVDLARHSLAHGVTKAGDYDKKRALQGFLILDQLACYARLGWTTH